MTSDTTDELELLRQRVKDLELVLGQGNDNLAVTFKLSPRLNSLFGLLLSTPNVTSDMVRQRMELSPDTKVLINRLRARLKQMHDTGAIPFEIKIVNRRQLGYWIEDDTKLKIRAYLNERRKLSQELAMGLTPKVTENPLPDTEVLGQLVEEATA